MASEHRRRYEGLGWAIARGHYRYLAVCIGTMVALAAIYILVVVPMAAPVVSAVPVPPVVRTLILFVPFVAVFSVLPTLAQVLATPDDERAAFEALNAHALLDRERWISSTGTHPRMPFLSAKAGKAWIEAHPGIDPVQRARVLIWGGEFWEAEGVIARLPSDAPTWRAQRAAMISLLRFVRDGDRLTGLLESATAELQTAPASAERDYALLNVAFEHARLEQAAGAPFWPVLARARRRLGALPVGASLRERAVAGIRSSAILIAIVGLLAAIVRL